MVRAPARHRRRCACSWRSATRPPTRSASLPIRAANPNSPDADGEVVGNIELAKSQFAQVLATANDPVGSPILEALYALAVRGDLRARRHGLGLQRHAPGQRERQDVHPRRQDPPGAGRSKPRSIVWPGRACCPTARPDVRPCEGSVSSSPRPPRARRSASPTDASSRRCARWRPRSSGSPGRTRSESI